MSLSAARSASHRTHRRRATRLLQLDSLESRILLSATTVYPIGNVFAQAVTHDGTGNLWVADALGTVDKVSLNADGSLNSTAYTVPPSGTSSENLVSIAYNPVNNHIYVTDDPAGTIHEMDLNGNVLNTYSSPNPADQFFAFSRLSVATDGSVWVSGEQTTGSDPSLVVSDILRISTDGTVTAVTLPEMPAIANAVSAAPDGSVWVGLSNFGDNDSTGQQIFGTSQLAHITADSQGNLTSTLYAIPANTSYLTSLTTASDGSVWYALAGDPSFTPPGQVAAPDQIQHATLAADGTLSIQQFDVPEPGVVAGTSTTYPDGLALDSTGTLWFGDETGNIITFNTNTDQFSKMVVADAPVFATSTTIIEGANGPTDVWYATYDSDLVHVDLRDGVSGTIQAASNPDLTAVVGVQDTDPLMTFTSSLNASFSYSVDYGNGAVHTGSLAFDASGTYTIPADITYVTTGNFPINVTITASTGDLLTVAGTATVSPAQVQLAAQGIDLSGTENQALAANVPGISTLAVASFTGPVANYTASITWGDGTTSAGTIVTGSNGAYYVALASGTSKTYGAAGSYAISVTITDGINSVIASSTATIAPTPLEASQGTVIRPILGRIVIASVANFTGDVDATASQFTATINWGDGTTSSGFVVRDPLNAGHFYVIGFHFYRTTGTHDLSILITDTATSQTATATAIVS